MTDNTNVYETYARAPLTFDHGNGVRLVTDDGTEYLDFYSGIAVNCLGHAHPHLIAALKDQADKLWHCSNLFQIKDQQRLAARLCAHTFADKVFFTNSGSEALECAFKSARRFHYVNGAPERIDILTFEGAFHGRTLAAIAAGGQEKYLEGFGPKTPGFISLPFGDLAAVKSAIGDQTAAILIEPVQGEGGVREVPTSVMRQLRELCDQHGLLLILDEVQTGVGRTGRLFAHEWSGIEPDIMAVAKGIGGGFPVGACLATAPVAAAMVVGTHGSTYGGNPLAMAVANAVLDVVLEDGFLTHVQDMALRFRQGLAGLVDRYPDLLEDISGSGLLIGLKAKVPNIEIIEAARTQRLLIVAAGNNVVRMAPPLIVNSQDVAEGLARLDDALASLAKAQDTPVA